jgi:hypothetical protein
MHWIGRLLALLRVERASPNPEKRPELILSFGLSVFSSIREA